MVMNIMEMFRRGTPTTPQPGVGVPHIPGQPAPVASPHAVNNSTVPTPNETPVIGNNAPPAFGTGKDGKSSLEEYSKLWEVDPKNPGGIPNPVPAFNLSAEKLKEAAAQVDFTSSISPELFEKASKGDATAFAEVIKLAGQAGFAQAAATTGTIVEDALTKLSKNYDEKVIPEILRRHTSSTALRADDNPIYQDPAAAPMLKLVETQLANKYPTASAAEITQHAKAYLDGFIKKGAEGAGLVITEKQPATPGNAVRQDTDFSKW